MRLGGSPTLRLGFSFFLDYGTMFVLGSDDYLTIIFLVS